MQRFLPLNRRVWKWFLLPSIVVVVILISAFGTMTSDQDRAVIGSMSSASSPTDHFRSRIAGFWNNSSTWESSPDSITWVTATLIPNELSSSILIWQNNTVQVTTNISFDQLTIIAGGTLRHQGGSVTIHDGPGDDLTIFPNGVFQFSGGSWPNYLASAQIRVKTGGIVRVETHIPELAQNLAGNLSSGRFIYETGSIFNWNNNTAFVTAGQTYFPDAGPNEMPIFRTSGYELTLGNAGPTAINGVLDVSVNTAFNGAGTKYFRNGIIGSNLLTQIPGSGKLVINGDTAIMGGAGIISLQASAGSNFVETGLNTYLTLVGNKEINSSVTNGKLIIKGNSTLDARTYALSGTAGINFESLSTLITANPEGISGSVGGMATIDVFIIPRSQTVIFNRNGLQSSGSGITFTAGRIIVTNGSKLTLSGGITIANLENGFFKIEGSGSELWANATRTIEIVGSRSLVLENGGTMHSSCMQFINLSTDFIDGIAILNGNGQPIKCNSISSTKITAGGMTIAPNTDIEIRTSLTVNYFFPAVFTDNANFITVGDDLQMTGSTGAAQYDLTGTIIMTGAGAGNSTSSIRNQSDGAIHAELNNLVINSNSSTSYPQFEPSSGNATIKIKGDFTIQNANIARPVRLFGNTYHIEGNYSNIHENRLSEGTSTLVFDGIENQTITCPGGEVYSNFEIDKATSDLELESDLTINGQGTFTSGLIHTGEHILKFGPASGAVSASQSSYVNGRVRKTGFTEDVPFIFPVGDFQAGTNGWSVFQPAELETEATDATVSFDVQYHHENFNPIFPLPFNPPTAGMGSVSTCNYWDIDRTSGTLEAMVGLSWNEAHCFEVSEPEALLVARYSAIAGDWSEAGSSLGSTHEYSPGPPFTTGWVRTEFPVVDFSPFAIGNIGAGANVLPIELLEFSVRIESSQLIMTRWTTLSEINNDFFTVERSANALDWEAVGNLPGAGNSHSSRQYQLADDAPISGRSYYRLKQTDYDGSYAYSQIETVFLGALEGLEIIHLFRSATGLELGYHSELGEITIEIYDVSGKRVFLHRESNGNAALRLSPNLTQGIYLLRISNSKNAVTKKFFY